uniref:Urease subunit alpha n=1 Tax=Lygus hesperus TaxID=30085 RepID=A0A0A9VZY4_LYGHE
MSRTDSMDSDEENELIGVIDMVPLQGTGVSSITSRNLDSYSTPQDKLSQQFAGNPDAMFTYVSPTPDPEDENAHVWVAMGTEEAEYAGLVNMVRESSGPPHACSMTEGEPEPWN